jgi:hypothetical protein
VRFGACPPSRYAAGSHCQWPGTASDCKRAATHITAHYPPGRHCEAPVGTAGRGHAAATTGRVWWCRAPSTSGVRRRGHISTASRRGGAAGTAARSLAGDLGPIRLPAPLASQDANAAAAAAADTDPAAPPPPHPPPTFKAVIAHKLDRIPVLRALKEQVCLSRRGRRAGRQNCPHFAPVPVRPRP